MNKPGAPPRVVQKPLEQSLGDPAPPSVDTPATSRVANSITTQYPRVGTLQKRLHPKYHMIAPQYTSPENVKSV